MDINLLTWLFLSALAAFRVAELLVIDDGPFEIFMNLRGWSTRPNPILKTIGGIANCVHCAGLWISALFAIFYFFQNVYTFGVILVFAVAGLQSVISNTLGRRV